MAKKIKVNGFTYKGYADIIMVYKGDEFLGTIPNDRVEISDLDLVLGMTDEIKARILRALEITGNAYITNFELINAGIDPMDAYWEDGDGNHVNIHGWGE